jgi:hypothetical protein
MLNALEKGDKMALNMALKSYKSQNGAVDFGKVLSVPYVERIASLTHIVGYQRVHTVLVAGVQLAMESLNLSNSLNAGQIFDLSDALIETASEDNLAIQDVVLFLQKLTRGEMGPLYSQMDIAKFMELFEVYREDRFQALNIIRDEQHVQHKAFGDPTRWAETHDKETERSMGEAMKEYMQMQYKNKDGE